MKDLLIRLLEISEGMHLKDLTEFEKILMFDLEWIDEKGLTKVGKDILNEYEMIEK